MQSTAWAGIATILTLFLVGFRLVLSALPHLQEQWTFMFWLVALLALCAWGCCLDMFQKERAAAKRRRRGDVRVRGRYAPPRAGDVYVDNSVRNVYIYNDGTSGRTRVSRLPRETIDEMVSLPRPETTVTVLPQEEPVKALPAARREWTIEGDPHVYTGQFYRTEKGLFLELKDGNWLHKESKTVFDAQGNKLYREMD
jgi:hypothetical protein